MPIKRNKPRLLVFEGLSAGARGPRGPQGPRGLKGARGPRGFTGPAGHCNCPYREALSRMSASGEDLDSEMPLGFLKASESGKGASPIAVPDVKPEAKPTVAGTAIFELSGAQISNDLQQVLPIVPGQCYRLQFRVKGATEGGGLVAELTYLNAGGGTLASYSVTANPGGVDVDAWISYVLSTAPAPTTATQVRMRFVVQGRSKSLQLADVVLAVDEPRI